MQEGIFHFHDHSSSPPKKIGSFEVKDGEVKHISDKNGTLRSLLPEGLLTPEHEETIKSINRSGDYSVHHDDDIKSGQLSDFIEELDTDGILEAIVKIDGKPMEIRSGQLIDLDRGPLSEEETKAIEKGISSGAIQFEVIKEFPEGFREPEDIQEEPEIEAEEFEDKPKSRMPRSVRLRMKEERREARDMARHYGEDAGFYSNLLSAFRSKR